MNNLVNSKKLQERYDACKSCTFFVKFTKECSKNKEFLDKYLHRSESTCPINKWS